MPEKDQMALSNMSDMCKHMSPQPQARPSNPQLHRTLLTKRYYSWTVKSHHHHDQDIISGEGGVVLILSINDPV